jgi:capsular polysaccharide biosynthesis protein
MEMRYYLRIIQRGWWLIVISALAAVNFSLIYSYYIATPMYESVARFIVSPNFQNVESKDLVNSLVALDKRSIISTYAEVLNSQQIINSTLDLLNLNPLEFSAYTTGVTVLPDANIIRFSVQGPNPEVAALLANSIGQHAIDYISHLYVIYDIEFLDKAIAAEVPFRPRPAQDAGVALLIGAVVGVGLAIFRDQLSGTLDRVGERRTVDAESSALTRSAFERRVRQEMAGQPEGVLTLGLIYLNGLQEIFDSLPQAYINQIMRKVTGTLKYELRGHDIVGRWSQLQFGVLLPSTDGASAKQRLQRIQQVLDKEMALEADGDFRLHLDPRLGLAERQGGESLPVLSEQAEKALEVSMQSDEKVYLYKVRPFG